jgi:Cytochrome c
MLKNNWLCVAVMVAGLSLATAVKAQQEQQQGPNPWSQCCGMGPWPMGPGMMGRGMGPRAGSMPRHHQAMMSGIPAPYDGLTNPLPRTRETVEQGAATYSESCASCHGATGRGDGEAGRNLSPPLGNLAWLSQMPMARSCQPIRKRNHLRHRTGCASAAIGGGRAAVGVASHCVTVQTRRLAVGAPVYRR